MLGGAQVQVNAVRALIALIGAVLTVPSPATTQHAAGVRVEIYGDHSDVGGGAPYAHLIGTFTAQEILFATKTAYNWHPYDLGNFGARVSGALEVASDGEYAFTLDTDDGSLLFIDGALVTDHGGGSGPEPATGRTFLTAGRHSFEIQFFEDYGGPSGLDLILPPGVSYGPLPTGHPVPDHLAARSR
jgi:PA14 domain-containing protein